MTKSEREKLNENEKYCPKCKTVKLSSAFGKHTRAKDGHYIYCRDCVKLDNLAAKGPIKRKSPELREGEKYCPRCDTIKLKSAFGKHTRSLGGLNCYCKKCVRETSRNSVTGVSGKHKANMGAIFNSYRIRESELQDLLLKQHGCCKICGADFGSELELGKGKSRQYVIDHCHDTGKVRGLLCGTCNLVIGYIEKKKLPVDLYMDYINEYAE